MDAKCQIVTENAGGEATIAAMDEYSRLEIGRKTYNFVRRILRNPEYRQMVEEEKARLKAAGYFDCLEHSVTRGGDAV